MGRNAARRSRFRDDFIAYLKEMAAYDRGARHRAKWAASSSNPLQAWFDHPLLTAYTLAVGGEAVGFGLIARAPYAGVSPGVDYRVSEFMIRPAFRGRGWGRQAALALLTRRPGRWEVRQVAGHDAARAFWRRVLADPAVMDPRETADDGQTRQSFRIMAESP